MKECLEAGRLTFDNLQAGAWLDLCEFAISTHRFSPEAVRCLNDVLHAEYEEKFGDKKSRWSLGLRTTVNNLDLQPLEDPDDFEYRPMPPIPKPPRTPPVQSFANERCDSMSGRYSIYVQRVIMLRNQYFWPMV